MVSLCLPSCPDQLLSLIDRLHMREGERWPNSGTKGCTLLIYIPRQKTRGQWSLNNGMRCKHCRNTQRTLFSLHHYILKMWNLFALGNVNLFCNTGKKLWTLIFSILMQSLIKAIPQSKPNCSWYFCESVVKGNKILANSFTMIPICWCLSFLFKM